MRLAIISSILHLPWGGADVLWTELALAASKAGNPVFLLVSPLVAKSPKVGLLIEAGAQVCERKRHAVWSGRLTMFRHEAKRVLEGRRDPIRELLDFKPDLIVMNQGGPFDFMVEPQLIDAIRSGGIPYALIAHSNDGSPLNNDGDRARIRDVISSAQTTAFVSRHNLKAAERQMAQTIVSAKVIQNPVNSPTEPPAWPASDGVRFATVSRLAAYDKGLDVLIPALADALGGEEGWSLDLYGSGESEQYLRDLIVWCGLEGRVRLAGFSDSIAAIWESHHMLLLPSRIEGCSLAMLEAMHHARPVLAARVGGVDDWIADGVNGFTCAAAEQECLAEALRRAWTGRERWQEMGDLARKTVRAGYDPAPIDTLLRHLGVA